MLFTSDLQICFEDLHLDISLLRLYNYIILKMYFCKKSLMVIVILCYYKILQFNTIYYFRRDICLRFFLSFKPFLGNKVFSTTSLTKLPDLFGPIRRPSSVKCPSRNFAWHLPFLDSKFFDPRFLWTSIFLVLNFLDWIFFHHFLDLNLLTKCFFDQ